jgi:hypothetical protein
LKESLKKNVFSSNISKIPKFILNKETEQRKKERERSIVKKIEKKKHSKKIERKKHRKKEKGRKAPRVSVLKKGNPIFCEKKTF